MLGQPIEYKSGYHRVSGYFDELVLESKSNKDIKCIWIGSFFKYSPNQIFFTWKFDWDELKSEGVYEITGHITVHSRNNWFRATKIDVKLTENNQEITKELRCSKSISSVYYQYSLIPHYAPVPVKPSYDEMFAPSDQNDTILVVEGKMLHVNKTFLSYHSEYFRALFSSNFKEGQMDEIPIGDVSYEDFALLLSIFYPNPSYPNDETVEKLLEMGRRFLVSSALSSAEHHLLNMSKINDEKMLYLADEYGMPTVLEKCIRKINTLEKARELKRSEKYDRLSDKTKLKVYECIVDSNSF
ncbi:hypothetical protein GCK72_004097 [Caenorhabditis remanei]|uniref:BTB domain-containing protein n=1 Tax=Caenorhabditis remanei TaxID=31234 RepID=A0A6A5H8I0_CAERE|nr:hypothetical protein GCK72_004097 [Caenorhabditis remanei]KAF1764150.1 hypothetical protein GCK72_004097 [Caenorhabditis remanei]